MKLDAFFIIKSGVLTTKDDKWRVIYRTLCNVELLRIDYSTSYVEGINILRSQNIFNVVCTVHHIAMCR